GYMALHNYEAAKEHLELAKKAGDQEQDLTYLLGEVMGQLYRKKLEEAEKIGNKDLRDARKKEIEKTYLQPALKYLNEYMKTGRVMTALVEGQIAFYKKDYGEALDKVGEAALQSPWSYEARKLEGDICIAVGKEKFDKGDYAGAINNFERAGEAYKK